MRRLLLAIPLLAIPLLLAGCPTDTAPAEDVLPPADTLAPPLDARSAADVPDVPDVPALPAPFVVMTFNTGSAKELAHDAEPDDGYTAAHAALTDEHYGNGLAWKPLIEDTRAFFVAADPDVVVFQEIFWPGECPSIPVEAQAGFVCEGWQPGDATVVESVLGPDYQVACHPGKPDKCAAVHARFGVFRGCDGPLCLEGMTGFGVDSCGNGARIARAVIDRPDGSSLTLVGVHGTSGFTLEEQACRVEQIRQVFVDLGDGTPGANGERNLIMGDFNTDPARMEGGDLSATEWNTHTAAGEPFHFISDVGLDVPATYAGAFNIDHVVSDVYDGSCWTAGVTPGKDPVTPTIFFDHKPIVCTLSASP